MISLNNLSNIGKNLNYIKPYAPHLRSLVSLFSIYAPIKAPMLVLYGASSCYLQYQRYCEENKENKENFWLYFMLLSLFPEISKSVVLMNEARVDFNKIIYEKKTDYKTIFSLSYNVTASLAFLSVFLGKSNLELLLISYLFFVLLNAIELQQTYQDKKEDLMDISLCLINLTLSVFAFHSTLQAVISKYSVQNARTPLTALPPWVQKEKEIEAIHEKFGSDAIVSKIEGTDTYRVQCQETTKIIEVKYLPNKMPGPKKFELIEKN